MAKGAGKGGVLESDGLARLICYGTYALYLLLGLTMMLAGVLFYTEMGCARKHPAASIPPSPADSLSLARHAAPSTRT